jgi:hypothetical protein
MIRDYLHKKAKVLRKLTQTIATVNCVDVIAFIKGAHPKVTNEERDKDGRKRTTHCHYWNTESDKGREDLIFVSIGFGVDGMYLVNNYSVDQVCFDPLSQFRTVVRNKIVHSLKTQKKNIWQHPNVLQ